MSASMSMSRFLSQPAGEFFSAKNQELALRLSPVFTQLGVHDLCSLVMKTEKALLGAGCSSEDLNAVRHHLGENDVRFAPGQISFRPTFR